MKLTFKTIRNAAIMVPLLTLVFIYCRVRCIFGRHEWIATTMTRSNSTSNELTLKQSCLWCNGTRVLKYTDWQLQEKAEAHQKKLAEMREKFAHLHKSAGGRPSPDSNS